MKALKVLLVVVMVFAIFAAITAWGIVKVAQSNIASNSESVQEEPLSAPIVKESVQSRSLQPARAASEEIPVVEVAEVEEVTAPLVEVVTAEEVTAPVVEVAEVVEVADPLLVNPSVDKNTDDFFGTNELDLSNPIGFPDFVVDPEAWMADTKENREAIVSKVLGVPVMEIDPEVGVAYAFNADGIALVDLPLVPMLTYHVHLSDGSNGRIVYFMGDNSSLSVHGEKTGDVTVRIAGFLAGEITNGVLCKPYWNAVKHDTRLLPETNVDGYFKENCLPVPEVYISEPDLVPTFEFLLKETGVDLSPMGEWDGAWYFWSGLGTQDTTCPALPEWTCYGTTDPVTDNPTYTAFTGTAKGLTAAFLFDPSMMDQEEINDFIEAFGLTIK